MDFDPTDYGTEEQVSIRDVRLLFIGKLKRYARGVHARLMLLRLQRLRLKVLRRRAEGGRHQATWGARVRNRYRAAALPLIGAVHRRRDIRFRGATLATNDLSPVVIFGFCLFPMSLPLSSFS